jgi:hypothetical protein
MPWTFYNSNGQRLSTATTLIDNLDIDGATDIGAAIVDADLFIIDDGAGGTNRKTAASRLKTFVGIAATQAEMEAGSSTTAYATPGRTQYHPGVAKVLGIYDNQGTFVSLFEYNVTFTDTAVGRCLFTFGTDFADTSYTGSGTNEQGHDFGIAAVAVGSVDVQTKDANGTALQDDERSGMAFFGTQV